MALKLFHRTSAEIADKIVRSGFKDGTGNYLTANKHSGVWLSDVPLDANEGPSGDTLLEVKLDLPERDLRQYEWIEKGKPYRKWLIPAWLINTQAKVRIIGEDEPGG